MHPLPHVPRNFRDMVEADLRRAARLIIKIQDEIDWQIRMASPDGDTHVAVTMPGDADQRQQMLRRIGTLFQWQQAAGFCIAVETVTPDAVYAIGISRHERHHCLARYPQLVFGSRAVLCYTECTSLSLCGAPKLSAFFYSACTFELNIQHWSAVNPISKGTLPVAQVLQVAGDTPRSHRRNQLS